VQHAWAYAEGQWGWNLVELSSDLGRLDDPGPWMTVLPYSGPPILARFSSWSTQAPDWLVGWIEADWQGPGPSDWVSSLNRQEYIDAVQATREHIAAGTIYQANICRVLSAMLKPFQRNEIGPAVLLARILREHPAPFTAALHLPDRDFSIVSASPELFLCRHGSELRTGPIKGTAVDETQLLDKDRAENVMIVDLMRNDLSKVCRPGSVHVPKLLEVQSHPGLVHLVSEIAGEVRPEVNWAQIVNATFPPGSVTGAPKSSAVSVIGELEQASRDAYCGAVGRVNMDHAVLAVTIRTFWFVDGHICFGTGAGITWSSDPVGEWEETVLKASSLLRLVAQERISA